MPTPINAPAATRPSNSATILRSTATMIPAAASPTTATMIGCMVYQPLLPELNSEMLAPPDSRIGSAHAAMTSRAPSAAAPTDTSSMESVLPSTLPVDARRRPPPAGAQPAAGAPGPAAGAPGPAGAQPPAAGAPWAPGATPAACPPPAALYPAGVPYPG